MESGKGYHTVPIEDLDRAKESDSVWAEWNPLRDLLAGHDSGWRTRDVQIQCEQQPGMAVPPEVLRLAIRCARKFGGPVLDLCCGTGRFALPLAQAGYEVVGLDYNEDLVCFGYIRPAGTTDAPLTFYEAIRQMSWQEALLLLCITVLELAEVYHRFDGDHHRFDAWMVLLKGKCWRRPDEEARRGEKGVV